MAADGKIVVDATIDTKGFEAGSQEMLRAVTSFGQAIKNLRNAITSPMRYFVDSVRQGAKESTRLEGEMRKLADEANRLKSQLNDQPVESEAYKKLQIQIGKADEAMVSLAAKQRKMQALGVSMDSKQWQATEYEIDQLVKKLDLLNKRKDKMEQNGTAYTGGRGSQEYEEQVQEINKVVGRLNELKQARAAALNIPGMIGGGLAAILGQIAVKAGSAAASLARMAATRAVGALRNLAISAKNAAINIGKMSIKAAVSALKRLASAAVAAGKALLGLNSSQKKTNSGFKIGFKDVLRYGLGIRSLYALFNRLRRVITDSFGAMAKQFPEVNATISKLATQLNTLKGNFGAAFEPIVTAIAPYLSQLISYLNTAMTSVSKFFAMLTGQSYYYRAKEVQIDYAKSLDKTTKSTKATTKATKDAENQLASFDALNILSANKNSGSNSGAQSAVDAATQEFEKVPLTGVSDWLERIKSAVKAGDYDGVGRILAGKINSIFETVETLVSWDNVGDKITGIIDAVTSAFNGLIDEVNWAQIGSTIGEGVNTIIYSLDALVSGVRWNNIGTKLATGINALINKVDWSNLGALLAKRVNAILDVLYGIADTFEWGAAGDAFADAVEGLVYTVNWPEIAATISGYINGIFTTMGRILERFSWGDVGATFADTVNRLIYMVNWPQIGSTIGGYIQGVLSTLSTFVERFNWGNAGIVFGSTVWGIVDKIDPIELGKALGNAINGALAWIRLAIRSFDWLEAGAKFSDTVNTLSEKVDWTNIGKTLAAAIGGPLKTLKEAVGGFNFGEYGKKFAETVNGFFSDTQFWEDIGTIFNDLVNGALDFSINFLENFDAEQFADDIKTALAQVDWPGIAKKILELLRLAIQGFGDVISYLIFGKTLEDSLKEFFEDHPLDEQTSRALAEEYFKHLPDGARSAFKQMLTSGMENEDIVDALRDMGCTPEQITNLFKSEGIQIDIKTSIDGSTDVRTLPQKVQSAFDANEINADVDVTYDGKTAKQEANKLVATFDDTNGHLIADVDVTYDGKEDPKTARNDLAAPFKQSIETPVTIVKDGWTEPSAVLGVDKPIDVKVRLTDNGGSVADNFTGWFKDKFAKSIPNISNVIKDFKLSFSGEADAMANALIKDLGESFDKVASYSGTRGDDVVVNFMMGFRNRVVDNGKVKSEFADSIKAVFSPAEIEALERGDLTVTQFFYAMGKGGLDEQGNATQQLSDLIAEITGDAAASATAGGQEAADNFTFGYILQTLASQGDTANAVDGAFNDIWSGLDAYGNGALIAFDYFAAFLRTVTDESGHVKPEFKDAVEAMFGSVEAVENGTIDANDFLYGLVNGVANSKGTAISQMTTLISEITGESSAGAEAGGKSVANQFTSAYILQTLLKQPDASKAVEGAFNDIWNDINAEGNGAKTADDYLQAFNDTVLQENGTIKEDFIYVIQSMFGSIGAYNYGDISGEDFLKGLVQGMWDSSGETSTKLVDIIDGILTTVQHDPNGMDEHSPSQRALQWGQDFLKGFSQGVDSEEKSTTSAVKTAFSTITDVAFAMKSMTMVVSVGMAAIKKEFTIGLNESKVIIDTALTGIVTGMQTQYSLMVQNTTAFMTTMRTTFSTNYLSIQATINTSMNAANQTFTRVFNSMNSTAQNNLSSIQNKAQTMLQNMVNGFNTQGQRMHDALANKLDNLANTVQNKMNNVYNKANSVNFVPVGENIVYGIANGINKRWSYIHDYVWNFAQSLLYNAERALGIRSPSRLFRDEVGKNISLGIAEGITDNEGAAIASINSISDSMVNQVDKMGALEARVTFRTPDIAAGGVLPYNVTASLTGVNESLRETLQTNNADLSDTVIQAVNNATIAIVRAIETYSTTNVNIDKRSLTDVLIEEINRRTRAQGSSPLLV